MSGKSENIIELKHISKVYSDNGFKAVDDFNLEVKRGEFVTFLGPSGCGKTTTLRMIAGFELPTDGQILLNGEDISQLPANKRPINTVFQRYALFPHMNIYENIAFGLKLKKLPKEEIRKKVKHVLDMVDLEGFEDRKISTLSGGQQQRIAMVQANLGLGFYPEELASEYIMRGEIFPVNLYESAPDRDIVLIRESRHTESIAAKKLINFLKHTTD